MESKKRFIARIFYIVVFYGLFGWVYEFIFYYFNFGMDKFYWQGGNFLPWINIYAYGALLIYLLTYKCYFYRNFGICFRICYLYAFGWN